MPKRLLEPYWWSDDVTLYQGDCLDVLGRMPSGSVHCCVTSPPYFGLRDYKIDDQIGLENSPDEYAAKLVKVFREVRRVLRDDGTLWLNLGDSYSGGGGYSPTAPSNRPEALAKRGVTCNATHARHYKGRKPADGCKSKDLIGIPWMVAFALRADGWYLRQDILWCKLNPMPESVKDRCTKAHEYVFLLTKSPRYFFDAEAIKEPLAVDSLARNGRHASVGTCPDRMDAGKFCGSGSGGRNKRSVWPVDDGSLEVWLGEKHPGVLGEFREASGKPDVWKLSTQPYKGAHYAVFPRKLVLPMVLAGTSEKGCCPECAAPWRRVTEKTKLKRERPNDYVKRDGSPGTGNSCGNTVAGVNVETLGWEPSCGCLPPTATPVPCTVLDPFCGSGTALVVASENGRRGIGIDLSETYLRENAVPRITESVNIKGA